MLKMRCHFNGGTCPYFTDGKTYEVRTPYISDRLGDVTDDKGHTRCIPIDGSFCAHIIREPDATDRYFRRHTCVGTWETLLESTC